MCAARLVGLPWYAESRGVMSCALGHIWLGPRAVTDLATQVEPARDSSRLSGNAYLGLRAGDTGEIGSWSGHGGTFNIVPGGTPVALRISGSRVLRRPRQADGLIHES